LGTKLRLVIALILASFAVSIHAQGVRYDSVAFTRGGFPAPGATIAVCVEPATVSTTPCSTLATLYTDNTTTTACSGTLLPPNVPGSACSNPMLSDGLGNYHFYAKPGRYAVQIYGSGLTTYNQRDLVLSCDPTSACNFTGNNSHSGTEAFTGAVTATSFNKFIYVDGTTYALTAAGIVSAISAANANGGGTVIIGPQGSSTIAMGSTSLTIPSNVCLMGGGPGQQTTLRWNSSIVNAIILSAGTVNSCVENLTLSFPTAAAASAFRISSSDVSEVLFNTFKDLQINWDSFAAGSAAFFVTNAGPSFTNFDLNTIENVNVQFANQLLSCSGCEGNHWNIRGQNLGATNGTPLVQFTGLEADEMGDFRIESGSGSATGLTCFSISGARNIMRITCDFNNATTLLNDTGDYNIFDLDVVPGGVGITTIGTVGAHTLLRLTNPADSKVYNISPSLGPSATQQHTIPAVASDTYALLNATQVLAGKSTSAGLLVGTVASGTATMPTAAIASLACSATVTVSATGVLASDRITANDNAQPAAATNGVLTIKSWPTANNVNFFYCNPTAGSVTPAAATLNWGVTR
jgi:hypothetical protein